MVFITLFQLFLAAVVVESFTELVVKSEIAKPVRDLVVKIPWFGKAMKCGYCFSFWSSTPTVLFGGFFIAMTTSWWINLVVSILLLQRTSNVIHNCIDKFTDKRYHGMYVNSDKED